ncbi:MAG TPA: hypothetical protein PLH94_12140 [Fimbriimonadaceae bacterium]|nr:hypothetical protein [Fimbriimonadaceae bacterium]
MRPWLPLLLLGLVPSAQPAILVDRAWSPTRGGETFPSQFTAFPGGWQLLPIGADDFTLRQNADLHEVVLFGSLVPQAYHSPFLVTLATEPCGAPAFVGIAQPSRQAVGVDSTGAVVHRLRIRFPFVVPLSAGRRYWLSAGPLIAPPTRPAFGWSSLKRVIGQPALSCVGGDRLPLNGQLPGGRRDLAFVVVGEPSSEF